MIPSVRERFLKPDRRRSARRRIPGRWKRTQLTNPCGPCVRRTRRKGSERLTDSGWSELRIFAERARSREFSKPPITATTYIRPSSSQRSGTVRFGPAGYWNRSWSNKNLSNVTNYHERPRIEASRFRRGFRNHPPGARRVPSLSRPHHGMNAEVDGGGIPRTLVRRGDDRGIYGSAPRDRNLRASGRRLLDRQSVTFRGTC